MFFSSVSPGSDTKRRADEMEEDKEDTEKDYSLFIEKAAERHRQVEEARA